MVTIKDVARLAGVSIATTSMALNNQARVKESTRNKVLEAAAALQYRPNGLARDLKVQRTELIGVLLHDLGGPFYSELLRGIQDVADSNGYTAIVVRSAGGKGTAIDRFLFESRVDGAIVLDPHIDDQTIRKVASRNLPVVLLDREIQVPYVYRVNANHEEGAYTATRHLISMGLKDIAYIGGPADSAHNILRFKGYQRALAEYHIPVPTRLTFHGGFTEKGGYTAAYTMIAQKLIPEGIIAANDEMAIGVLGAFKNLGIRVPEDVALVGFDDIRLAQYVTPSLTTVSQPMYELGTVATHILFRALQGEEEIEPITLPTEIVIRQSSMKRNA